MCPAGQPYTFDPFRAGDPDRVTLDGPVQTGQGTVEGPVAQAVYVYFSTDAADVAARDYQRPQLQRPRVVPGHATFNQDFTDEVSHSDTGQRGREPGAVGFE